MVPLQCRQPDGNTGTTAETGTTQHTATTVPSDLTGTISANRQYSSGTIEGPLLTAVATASVCCRVLYLVSHYCCNNLFTRRTDDLSQLDYLDLSGKICRRTDHLSPLNLGLSGKICRRTDHLSPLDDLHLSGKICLVGQIYPRLMA